MSNAAKVFELTKVRISYNRLLHYQDDDLGALKDIILPNPFLIPFGSVTSVRDHKFFLRYNGSDNVELFATAETSNDEIQILPEYRWVGKLDNDEFGKIDVEIRELVNDIDRMHAMQIVMRSHYLNPPLRGLFVGCWLTNPEQVRRIKKKSLANKKEFWSSAWNDSVGRNGIMVGCAVLDTLFQGIPNGRRTIVQKEKLGHFLDDLGNWKVSRREIVNTLKIAWASRFAVDEPYRQLNIGALLAKKLVDIAYFHRVPRANYIEVITTEPKEKAQERLKHPKTSFLGRAGYTLDQNTLSSRPMLVPDKNGNRVLFESSSKLYYFMKTSSHANRKK